MKNYDVNFPIFMALTLVVFTAAISGCGSLFLVSGIAGQSESFNGKEIINLPNQTPNILDVIVNVGKDMGYDNFAVTDKNGTRGSSPTAGVMGGVPTSSQLPNDVVGVAALDNASYGRSVAFLSVGYSHFSTITVMVKDLGRTLDVSYSLSGNYGTGGQEAGKKLIEDFKSRILEKTKLV